MTLVVPLSVAVLILLTVTLALHTRRQSRELREQARARERAVAGEQDAIRTLRLAAQALRAPAMSLLGHAERLADEPAVIQHSAAITGLTRDVLTLADDLQDHMVGEPGERVLRPDALALAPLLRAAIETVEASLGPSRRHWHLAPDIDAVGLLADRRALTEILHRVIGSAARLSRDSDTIEIRAEPAGDGLALIVEDEGAGLPADADVTSRTGRADRGLGLGLSLARTLMEAHGGELAIASAPGVGSRILLRFPSRCPAAADAFA